MIDYTSIETQIQRIQGKVAETYDIAETKGAEIPASKNIDNLPATVASITGGGGVGITKELLDGSLEELNNLAGATTLKAHRFRDFTLLETLNLGAIKDIPPYTCYACSVLKSLTLSNQLTDIREYAFYNCRDLEISELPKSITNIEQYALYYAAYNKSGFNFEPTNVASIGNYAFQNSALKKLIAELSNIETYAFQSNTKLTEIDLEINGAIGNYAFQTCQNVDDFNIKGIITTLGDYAFSNFGSLRDTPVNNIFDFDLRNGTFTTVGQYAFQGSSNAVRNKYFNVYLPKTLTAVNNYAFRYTDNFNIFFTSDNPPTAQSATFTNSDNMKIFVPYSKADAYRTLTNWSAQSEKIYGWAEENTFELNDDLPFANEEGFGLTWYDDMEMTNQVTTVADPTAPLYCAVGAVRIAVLFKSLSQYQATSVITDGVKNYNQGDVIAVGTNLTITLTGDVGFDEPYITTLNGNNITSPHSFTVGQDDLEIVNIFWDEVNVPINPTFNQNTPAQIEAAAVNNLAKNFWTKGDNIDIALTDSSPANVRIADLQESRYDKKNGGKTNIVLEFSMIIKNATMNATNTNEDGWEGSRMRTVTMDEIYNLLPSEWQAIIPTVLVPTANGGSQSGVSVVYSEDKLFLPSEIEISGNSNQSHSGEGTQFDYYVGTANAAKIKQLGGSNAWWWLRSPHRSVTYYFVSVGSSGFVSNNSANYSHGVSPCFAI